MLLFVLSFVLAGCYSVDSSVGSTVDSDGRPRIFHADYNRVWNAAIDTLVKHRFIIRQMSKEDGFITTDKRESIYSRTWVSIRLTRMDGAVKVAVSDYHEELDRTANPPYWHNGLSSWRLRKGILDSIESRL